MMELTLTHATVRSLAKNLRARTGREIKHTDIVEDIAAAFGLRGDAMMHALKGASRAARLPETRAKGDSPSDGAGDVPPAAPLHCRDIAARAGMQVWKLSAGRVVLGRRLSSNPEEGIVLEVVAASDLADPHPDLDAPVWSVECLLRHEDGRKDTLARTAYVPLRSILSKAAEWPSSSAANDVPWSRIRLVGQDPDSFDLNGWDFHSLVP